MKKHRNIPEEAKKEIEACWNDLVAADLRKKNILALIYDEKSPRHCFNIFTFNENAARTNVVRIQKVTKGKGRKHPVYRFFDSDSIWICEVRYGSGTANALQRVLWTHTKNGLKYFDSVTNGWIDYSHNHVLVQLFSHALIATSKGHEAALTKLKEDIEEQKQILNLR